MISIVSPKCRSLSTEQNYLFWQVTDTDEDIYDYKFQILRSESEAGPFMPVSDYFEDQYQFVDVNIPKFNIFRQLHYKIAITHKHSGNTTESDAFSKDPEANLIVTEIRTHINLLMREFVGRRCWVLPIRTFGQRCSDCYNFTLKKKRKSGCSNCFDSTFTRGYLKPIESWVQIDPNNNDEQQSTVGTLQPQNSTARMGFYPQLKPGDLIVEPENIRWRCISVNSTQHNKAPIHQEVTLHQIPTSDIEYKVPLELTASLATMYLSPSRNFTNPQTIESAGDAEIPDILGIYPAAR